MANIKTKLEDNIVPISGIKYSPISMKDFLSINCIYNNRGSELRVNKMRQSFENAYLKGHPDTLSQVAIGIATKDFTDPESGATVKKDEVYVMDGNTRSSYWKHYTDRQENHKDGLVARIHYLDNASDVEMAYYPYDSSKSSENKADMLFGLNRSYGFSPKQQVFSRGGFGCALGYASINPLNRSDKLDVFEQYNLNATALRMLDGVPKNSFNGITNPVIKSLKSQAIIGSCLLALRVYGNGNVNLFDFIGRLSTIEFDEIDNAVRTGYADPVQMVALEYSGESINRNGREKRDVTQAWLSGMAGSTRMADIEPQMDFILYHIVKYMNTPTKTIDISAVQSTVWRGEWNSWYNED